jgi:hypothetical protein
MAAGLALGDRSLLKSSFYSNLDVVHTLGHSLGIEGQEPLQMDRKVILLLSLLECEGRGYWGSMPNVLFELEAQPNVCQISEGLTIQIPPCHAVNVSTSLDPGVATLDAAGGGGGVDPAPTLSSQHARTHFKYASGEMLFRPAFCSLLAAAYYNPASLDLLRAMTKAADTPTDSTVFKVPVSCFLKSSGAKGGISFKEIFEEVVAKDVIPIGIYRDCKLSSPCPQRVVITCPVETAEIGAGDEIFVIASGSSPFLAQYLEERYKGTNSVSLKGTNSQRQEKDDLKTVALRSSLSSPPPPPIFSVLMTHHARTHIQAHIHTNTHVQAMKESEIVGSTPVLSGPLTAPGLCAKTYSALSPSFLSFLSLSLALSLPSSIPPTTHPPTHAPPLRSLAIFSSLRMCACECTDTCNGKMRKTRIEARRCESGSKTQNAQNVKCMGPPAQ